MEYLILFLPLLGSIISGFFGKTIGDRLSQLITCILVSISALLSLFIFFKVVSSGYEHNAIIATWINSGSLNVNWSIKVDALSAVMLVVVTLVSSLVQNYLINQSLPNSFNKTLNYFRKYQNCSNSYPHDNKF